MKKFYPFILFLLVFQSINAQIWLPDYKITIWYGDTLQFETDYPYLQTYPSDSNVWQIGTPSKTVFNAAFSPSKAIITDTLNPYPANNHSYFDVKIGAFNFFGFYENDMFIDMKHQYHTDSLSDGGYISVSYDNGATFMNIIRDTVYNEDRPAWENLNLYNESNTLYNGEFGFSGNSDGWVNTGFAWHYTPVINAPKPVSFPDTLILRFNFISDDLQSDKEGWMIDNIRFFAVDLGSNIDNPQLGQDLFSVYPNPLNNEAVVSLNKVYKQSKLRLFTASGKAINEQTTLNTDKIYLNRANLPPGLYILQLIADDKINATRKIIIR